MYTLIEREALPDGTYRNGNSFEVETVDEAVRLIKRGEAKAEGHSCYVVPVEWNVDVDVVTVNDEYNSE